MRWVTVSLGVAAVLLAGCTQSTGIALPDPPAPAAVTTPAVPTADPSSPVPLGTTLAVAEAGAQLEVTVFNINQDGAPNSAPKSGGHWASADVQTCVKQTQSDFATKATDWAVSDAAGLASQGTILTDASFPSPTYPISQPLGVGQCVRGWTLFPVDYKAVVSTVGYAPESGPAAVWEVSSGKVASDQSLPS